MIKRLSIPNSDLLGNLRVRGCLNPERKEEKMWATPSKEELEQIPKLYVHQEVPPEDKMVVGHFFIGGCDWWVTEFDGEDLFYGFACLGDPLNAEWGYTSLDELAKINVRGIEVDRNLYWSPKRFAEMEFFRGGYIN